MTSIDIGIAIGNVFIGDQSNNRIRKITASTSIIATIAGTGTAGFSGDGGQATAASIKNPVGIFLDSAGNLYFCDYGGYNVVRKITVSTGIISTIAGTGSTSGGYNGDNMQATAATLNYPGDVGLDSAGNVYICDAYNNRVRKVDAATGMITTVVGTGAASSTGDGSAATSATVNGPGYIRFAATGIDYYISDCGGARVRKVVTVSTGIPSIAPSMTPTVYPSTSPLSIGVISTIAGTGASSFGGDGGQATSATITTPAGIVIDSSNNVYVSDYGNHRVRKITVSTGIITTYAGTGTASYSGDGGAASSADLSGPSELGIDSSGMNTR